MMPNDGLQKWSKSTKVIRKRQPANPGADTSAHSTTSTSPPVAKFKGDPLVYTVIII